MSLLKSLVSSLIKSKLDDRKKELQARLIAEISSTESAWVKARNQAYINLLDGADKSVVNRIEKELDKL